MSMPHIRPLASLILAVIAFSGQLLDQTTSQPLAHVKLRVSGQASAGATTNADGRFTLRVFKPGTYAVTAESDDVPPQTFRVTVGKHQSSAITVKLCSTTLDYHCATPND
jgi:hypothetical protein